MLTDDRNYFRAFVNVSKAISSTHDLHEILDLIILNAVEVLGLRAGAFSLWNKHENRLEMIAHLNLSEEFLSKGPVFADKSVPRALTSGSPVIIPDIEEDDQLQYPEACRREGIKALLSIPVIFHDETVGVLRLFDYQVRHFDLAEIDFMLALAEQGGVAVTNALYMSQIHKDHAREMDDLWDWFSDLVETPHY